MNDRDPLKDLLDRTAPDQPDLPAGARAGAVRERATAVRRRNGLVLAAAVLAVVGVGVGVPVLTSGDDPAPDRGSDVADRPERDSVVAPPACPAEPLDVQEGLAVDDLPDGASSARLCPATFGSQQGTIEFTLPTDPVTGDEVDTLTSGLRGLEAKPLPSECMAMSIAPMPWALVVSYPDGSTRTLGSTMTTCSTVGIAGQDVLVDDVLALVQQAVPGGATQSPGDLTPDGPTR